MALAGEEESRRRRVPISMSKVRHYPRPQTGTNFLGSCPAYLNNGHIEELKLFNSNSNCLTPVFDFDNVKKKFRERTLHRNGILQIEGLDL